MQKGRTAMRLNRRQFMIGASGALSASVVAGCQAGPGLLVSPRAAGGHEAHGAGTVPQPAEAGSAPGSSYELVAQWIETDLDGTPVRLRGYNGQVPGPLLETRPGETLRILVRNELPPYDSSAWGGDHNVPHHLDYTNLHVHGMEVIPHLFQPLGTSDPLAEMIAIGPGEDYEYVFQIPEDHPPGLYWYHPHHHGSTVVQAVSGMAGGLVVRGLIDEVPEIAAAREIMLVVNDIGLFPSEDDPAIYSYNPVQNAVWNTMASKILLWNAATQEMEPAPDLNGGFTTGDYKLRYFLANGQPFFKEEHNAAKPMEPLATQLATQRFTLRPGEVVRFRMLNANSDDVMPVVVEGHPMYLLALDGVNFPAPRTIAEKPITGAFGDEQLLLAPANRAEFLLQAGAPGVYKIVQLTQTAQFLESISRTIAEIEVTGDPIDPPMRIPSELPTSSRYFPLIDPSEVVRRRNIVFSSAFPGVLNPIIGLDFMLNNSVYDVHAIPHVVELDTAEEWHLSVPDASHGGSEGHPFHIHVNSFEVISVAGQEQPPGTILDTVWVPAGSEVVIRMKFRQWTGKSVFHCHILPHEDTGMMQNFLIID
jgi:FtsP/CotA-like multicopper oxidase with cupredoxin domain